MHSGVMRDTDETTGVVEPEPDVPSDAATAGSSEVEPAEVGDPIAVN